MSWKYALQNEKPMQIVGVINAYVALMAKEAGFRALYLSGAGVANFSYGLPDLALTSLENVLDEVRKITATVETPLLVDIDTGWGGPLNVARTIREMERAGASAVHIEDQEFSKKCGHKEGKKLVSTKEMVARIKAAVDARTDETFQVMARTDAIAVEGMEKAIERSIAYVDAGADMIFAEACTSLSEFQQFREQIKVPILANLTEFGKTPHFTTEELREMGIDMVLYPLSCARAMNQAAWEVLQTIRREGSQKSCVDRMQTREKLEQFLSYREYERKIL